MNTSENTIRILSIDAWREPDGGWTWNQWFHIGDAPAYLVDAGTRPLLKWLRDNDILAPYSAGRVAVENDGYNVVIMDKGTFRPLIALEYGASVKTPSECKNTARQGAKGEPTWRTK